MKKGYTLAKRIRVVVSSKYLAIIYTNKVIQAAQPLAVKLEQVTLPPNAGDLHLIHRAT